MYLATTSIRDITCLLLTFSVQSHSFKIFIVCRYILQELRKFYVVIHFRNNKVLASAQNFTIVKKSQKRSILLLSSHAFARSWKITTIHYGTEIRVENPEIIAQYNKYMGGIDTNDQMLYTYINERRSSRYWKKVTFNIISRMVLHCYILYRENPNIKTLTKYKFTANIIEKLSVNWIKRKHLSISIARFWTGSSTMYLKNTSKNTWKKRGTVWCVARKLAIKIKNCNVLKSGFTVICTKHRTFIYLYFI